LSRDKLLPGADFLLFFPLGLRTSAASPWQRVLSSLPYTSAPTWLHQTRMEVLSPLRRRVQRPLSGVAATEKLLGARIPSSAKKRHNVSGCPVRVRLGRGAAHANQWRPSPYGQERERVSNQRAGIKDNGLCARRRSTTQGINDDRAPVAGASSSSPVRREAHPLPSLRSPWKNFWVSKATSRLSMS